MALFKMGDPPHNPLGRPKGSKDKATIHQQELEFALQAFKETHDKSFIEFFVEKAITNPRMAR